MFLPYVIIGVNTSSLIMVAMLKCGRWEIGGPKLWEVGDWVSKFVGGWRLGVKICGRWEIVTPVSRPPPLS